MNAPTMFDPSTPLATAEEYEPHLEQGTVIYAGVDYAAILRLASCPVLVTRGSAAQ
jgi:predicted GTPase